MTAFGLKECSHHLMVPQQGDAMAEIPVSLLLALLQLDH